MNLQEAKNLILQHPGQYYTYLLKRPNGIPFYVGKGNCKGFRIETHTKEALLNTGINKHKENIIRKILEDGNQVDYEIVIFTSNEEDAFDKEIELISFYGRKDNVSGVLANLTDGGEGCCGQIMSSESRKKISKAVKGRHLSEETKRKISKAAKGRICSEELRKHKSKMLKGCVGFFKGKKHTEETKVKMSEVKKGKTLSKEHRMKLSESRKGKSSWNKGKSSIMKGKHHSKETKMKISESLKGKSFPR